MKSYTKEFKEQVVKEVQEVGNISLVCRRHDLRTSTVHTWLHKDKNKEAIADQKEQRDLRKKIKDQELEITVLRALLKKTYPLWNSEKELS